MTRPMWPSYACAGSTIFRSFDEVKTYVQEAKALNQVDHLICPLHICEDEFFVHWNNRTGLKLTIHVTKKGLGPYLSIAEWQTLLDCDYPI